MNVCCDRKQKKIKERINVLLIIIEKTKALNNRM